MSKLCTNRNQHNCASTTTRLDFVHKNHTANTTLGPLWPVNNRIVFDHHFWKFGLWRFFGFGFGTAFGWRQIAQVWMTINRPRLDRVGALKWRREDGATTLRIARWLHSRRTRRQLIRRHDCMSDNNNAAKDDDSNAFFFSFLKSDNDVSWMMNRILVFADRS